jgi:hypothetical protein
MLDAVDDVSTDPGESPDDIAAAEAAIDTLSAQIQATADTDPSTGDSTVTDDTDLSATADPTGADATTQAPATDTTVTDTATQAPATDTTGATDSTDSTTGF